MLDMVFEHRNKAYGAYVLRSDSNRAIKQAMLSILSLLTVFCLGNFIRENMHSGKKNAVGPITELNPTDVGKVTPPAAKVKPPVQPPKPPHTAAAVPTIRNTEHHVVAESHVQQDSIPENRDLENIESGTTTNTTASTNMGVTDGTGKDQVFVVARNVEPTPQVYGFVEQMPEFPGGEKALLDFIAHNTQYPQMERDNDITGKVITQFTVNEDGTISDIQILRSPSSGFNREATRVIKMLPTFKPGRQQGRAVKVRFNVPFVFKLN
jgi:protein TonB